MSDRTSFVEILRAIDDTDLDVYEFRVWVHIWRVGTSWESLRTIARQCGMSLGKASQARQSLFDRNMLVYQQRNGKLGLAAVLCSPHEHRSPNEHPQRSNRSPGEQNVHEVNTNVHQVNDSVHEVNTILSMPHEVSNSKGGEGARKQKAPASPPSPPVTVKYQSTDRTPGGRTLTPPADPQPSPNRERPPEVAAVGQIANTLTDVTGVSSRLNWSEVGGLAAELHESGYTAEQVRTHYGRDQSPGLWNWYTDDWRGKKNDRPRLKEIRETIAGATQRPVAPTTKKRVDPILAALAAFEQPPTPQEA